MIIHTRWVRRLGARREKSSELDIVNMKDLHENVGFGSGHLSKSNSRGEKKRDASKPLYLVRYE